MRRAKIVATFGPAIASYENTLAILDAGVDVARMNMSHGDHSVHDNTYENVRKAASELGKAVALWRTCTGRRSGWAASPMVRTSWPWGTRSPSPSRTSTARRTLVRRRSKGCPRTSGWAIRRGVDFVALSFVRNAADVQRVHEITDEEGRRAPVIAKIEKPQAVDVLDEIIDAFDAIMVARGDLGVELPLEEVPLVQKRAIEMARRWAKPVIVATQVLESMIDNPRPTRAEASDCANAVIDGADAVMLSGETSVGKYPIETVRTMARIIESAEEHGLDRIPPLGSKPKTRGGAITRSEVEIANQLDAKFICTFTQSGDSARRLSRLRPVKPVFAFSPVEYVSSQLALARGIQPLLVEFVSHTDEMTQQVDRVLLEPGFVEPDPLVVIAAGSPPGVAGSTNLLKVHKVGDLADAGQLLEGRQRPTKEKVGPWPALAPKR